MSLTTRQSRMLGTSDGAAASVAPAVLGLRSVCTQQPQQAVGIDWSNPITRGLVSHWLPSYIATGPAPNAINKVGTGISTNGTSEYKTVPVNGVIYNAITVMSIVDMNMRASSFERICAVIHSGSSSGLQLYEPGSGVVQVFTRDSANTNVYANFTLPRKTGVLTIVGRSAYTSASIDCFIDGIKQTQSGSSSNGNGTAQSGTTEFRVGSHKEDGAFYYGRHKCINVAVAWNRLLSDTEIRSISQNPWQIFLPLTKQVWVAA